jgi:hypothetical protein
VSKAADGGAPRLVRTGPRALVEFVDEDGRIRRVEEATPKTSPAAALAIFVGATFGIVAAPLAVPALTGATNPSPIR